MQISPASADIITYDFSGYWVWLNPENQLLVNSDFASNTSKGHLTEITGTLAFNDGTLSQSADLTGLIDGYGSTTLNANSGIMTIDPFDYLGSGALTTHDITLQAIGAGDGINSGTLMAGHMLFDWSGNNNIGVDLMFDAAGFFNSASALPSWQSRCIRVIFGVCEIAAGPADANGMWLDHITGNLYPELSTIFDGVFGPTTVLGGPALLASVDGNPFATEDVTIFNSSGDEVFSGNRHTDGISGIAMDHGPFQAYTKTFDIYNLTPTASFSAVPVPSAIWLLGSGLVGLTAMARRT